jgi:hypothetical protein
MNQHIRKTKSVKLRQRLLFCSLIMAASCTRVEDPISQDQLALELLNSGRYSDAVIVLEGQVKENPGDGLARLRLASAYAGKVGFNLVDAFAAFEPLIAFDPNASRIPVVRHDQIESKVSQSTQPIGVSGREPTSEEREKIKRFEKNLLVTILDSEMATRILFSLPYLSEAERSKVAKGIVVLREIPHDSSSYRMGLIYESVIQFLLFSNYMRDSFLGVATSEEQSSYSMKMYCGLDLRIFLTNLPLTLAHLRAGMLSLSAAGSENDGRFFQNVQKALRSIESLHRAYLEDTGLFNIAEIADRKLKENVCEQL